MMFKCLSKAVFGVSLFIVISSFPLLATTIHVPGDYPTIQQGLNAAQLGDTVLVAPGTYTENINWPSRDGIVLTSESGADTTIIDGGAAGTTVTFPNFSFSQSTIIKNFAVQNGAATKGAGLYVRGSPYILANIIQRNIAQGTSTWVYGGGIFCYGTASPLIEGNLIRGNVAKGEYWNYGGGIYVDYNNSAIILLNTIESDSTIGGYWNYGAGIYCDGQSSPTILHNIIQYNTAYQGDRGHGVGIYSDNDADSYILSNLIYNNTAQSGSWNYGAGILVNSGSSVINNTIVENRCLGGSWAYGGGIFIYDSTNTIGNNIVANNTASTGGGVYAYSNGYATLLNNDVWNNSGGNYSGIPPGSNDISVDPLFVTGPLGDYYLSQTSAGQGQDSPCLDYGFATAESLGLDTYTTRTDTVPDSGMVDLGYHYPTTYQSAIEEKKQIAQNTFFNIYPSLSRTSFRIQLQISLSQNIELKVFDNTGRLKSNLFDGKLSQGKHEFTWNGVDRDNKRVPAGTYFIVMKRGTSTKYCGKVSIIR